MNIKWLIFAIPVLACLSATGQEGVLKYNFNDFSDGPISGQMDWNVYDKVKDTSALSIMSALGTSEADSDKALVIKAADTPIRCVTGEPTRWLPGYTLTMEFDFRVAIDPRELSMPKPVMTVMLGNSLLSPKARWAVNLEASPSGDWVLIGAMPDGSSERVYGENFLIRSDKDVSISQWYKFRMVAKKLTEPDSFETRVEILGAESGELIADIDFSDNNKDRVAQEMWNTSRAHVGFYAAKDQVGLVCIDNLVITSNK